MTVAAGRNVGGDFKHIPGCTRAKETGCVMAFSTFDAPVPDNTLFGRPSGRVGTDLPTTGDVLCTNPAALGGGSALLTSVFPSAPFAPGTTIGIATQAIGQSAPTGLTTPWFQLQGYSGTCDAANNAHVLQISPVGGAPTLHAVPNASWGLHLVDANIALGNLVGLVRHQAAVWLRTH